MFISFGSRLVFIFCIFADIKSAVSLFGPSSTGRKNHKVNKERREAMEEARERVSDHLLAEKIFLLKHQDVQLSEKLALKQEVLNAIKLDDRAPLYKALAVDGLLEADQKVLNLMRFGLLTKHHYLNKWIEYAMSGRNLRQAHLDLSLFFMRIGYKNKALKQLEVTESMTDDAGQKMDLVLYKLQVGFFHRDFDLISQIIETKKSLFDVQYCPVRTKHYKVYEALYWLHNRDYKKAAALFLTSIQDSPSDDPFLPYNTFVCYAVLSSITVLDASGLQEKFLNDRRMSDVVGRNECVSRFLKSVINRQYNASSFKDMLDALKFDQYFYPNQLEYITAVRITFLPNKTVGMWTKFQKAVKRVSLAMKDPLSNAQINVLDETNGLVELHTELVHIARTTEGAEGPLRDTLGDFYNGGDLEEMAEGLKWMFDRLCRDSWNESSKLECFEVGFRLHSLASETSNKGGLLLEFITEFGDFIQSVLLDYVTKKVEVEDVNLEFKWVFEYGYDYCSLLRCWFDSDSS